MSKSLKSAVGRILAGRGAKRGDAEASFDASAHEPSAGAAPNDHGEHLTKTFMLRGISAEAIDLFADCPKKFDFFLRGREQADVRGVADAIEERVRQALELFFELDPDERTHAAIEPTLAIAWKLAERFPWVSTDEDDAARSEARRILHDFVENHDLGGHTTGQTVTLSSAISTVLGDVMLEALVERIVVKDDEIGLTLVAYDMGEPGEHKFSIESDPVMRMWLLVVTDSLRQPVIRIKNVFVKHDVEEVFEVRPGDVDVSRDALSGLLNALRMASDAAATPGPWCASCGYRFICSDCDVRIGTEGRIASHGGLV